MATVTMKRGDTRKSIVIDCFMPDGRAVDFAEAGVQFLMTRGNTVLLDHVEAYIESEPENGVLAYHFEDGDTDKGGIMRAWFKVTYPDGSRETFPDSGSLIINIE
jgi:hypothetical protein